MRLYSKGLTLSLQRRYDWLIRTFLTEELGSLQPRLHNLSVYAVRGNICCPAGRVHIASNDRITITVYKGGIDRAHLFRDRRVEDGVDGKVAFNTFVLLHEVAHVVQAYRDLEFYRQYIDTDAVFRGADLVEGYEQEADELAAGFIERHRLFGIRLTRVRG